MSDKNQKNAVSEEEPKTTTETTQEETMEQPAEPTSEVEGEQDQTEEAEPIDQVGQLQQQVEEEKNKYLRLYAEFENFRRRNAKERIELISSASSELMAEILPVLDDFERAIESNKAIDDLDGVKKGFELLYQKMKGVLSNKGLKAIESKGEAFDAEIHEAVAQVPVEDKKQKGQIIDIVEKGYKLNDKVIRHPKVVVGS